MYLPKEFNFIKLRFHLLLAGHTRHVLIVSDLHRHLAKSRRVKISSQYHRILNNILFMALNFENGIIHSTFKWFYHETSWTGNHFFELKKIVVWIIVYVLFSDLQNMYTYTKFLKNQSSRFKHCAVTREFYIR